MKRENPWSMPNHLFGIVALRRHAEGRPASIRMQADDGDDEEKETNDDDE